MSNLLTTSEAAVELGVTHGRVRQLIDADILPAQKRGRDWIILRADLPKAKKRKRTRGPDKKQSV